MIFGLSLSPILAQDLDSLQHPTEITKPGDSLIVKEKKKPQINFEVAGFVTKGLEFSPQYSGMAISEVTGFGIMLERYLLGFVASKAEGKLNEDPFFPVKYNLPQTFGAINLGKRLLNKNNTSLWTNLSIGKGDLVWKDSDTDRESFSDRFKLIQPNIQVTHTIFNSLQLYGSAGYRKVMDLELTQVDPDLYNGFIFNLGLRLGYFHKPREK